MRWLFILRMLFLCAFLQGTFFALSQEQVFSPEAYQESSGSFGIHATQFAKFSILSHKTNPRDQVLRKSYHLGCFTYESLLAILQLAQTLSHPNLVTVRGIESPRDLVAPGRQKLISYMKYHRGEELFSLRSVYHGSYTYFRRFPPFWLEIQLITKQLFEVLAYLESEGLNHCDVKLENIMLQELGSIDLVLIDVDFLFSATEAIFLGTVEHFSPEILHARISQLREEANYPPQHKRDVWAAGVSLYLLVLDAYPFPAKEKMHIGIMREKELTRVFEKLLSLEAFDIPYRNERRFPPGFSDFLSHLLDKNPNTRYTAQEALQHPWLQLPPPREPDEKDFSLSLVLPPAFAREESAQIQVHPQMTLSELKDAIMMKFRIRHSAQALFVEEISGGTVSRRYLQEPHLTLAEKGISSDAVVHVRLVPVPK